MTTYYFMNMPGTTALSGLRKLLTFTLLLWYGFLANAQTPDANGIVYVKPVATGTGSGNSWANATSSLRTAITAAGVSKIYAAVGYYHVQGGGIISMKNGVEIYGGFIPVNDETDWATRFLPNKQVGNYGDWWNLEGSIIDGMTWNGGSGETIVINNSNLNNTAVLDGFSVVGGNGYSSGGGIINNNASPTLRNLVISSCSGIRGGAIYNNNSSPVVTDVIISANYANETISGTAGEGGGVHNRGNSSPVFTNTLFINNNAVIDYKGGAVYHTGTGTATFINCTFNNNTSGVNNPPSVLRFNSVTVDTATTGTVSFINSIVFGTVHGTYTAQHSMIQGHTDTSDGNMNADPYAQGDIFISPTTGIVAHLGNYGLKNDAAVLNAGSNALFPGLDENSTDIRGNSRVLHYNDSGIIDMGAYENQYVPLVPTAGIVYVKPAATGEMDGSSWDNATSDIYSAVLATGVQKVFVAIGNHNLSDHSVVMKNGVEIYGGFDPDNGITDLTHNRILPNPSTNITGSVLNALNKRPVIYNDNNGVNNTAVLDGFTLTNGKYSSGGAVYNKSASPTLKNLWIKGNSVVDDGGGIFNLNSSSPVMTNVTIENNTARYGGGVFNRNNSSPVMTNVIIKGNSTAEDGAGMYNDVSASPVMTNVSITGNTGKNGAGIYNRNNCSPVLTNVLIANNTAATNGGAIRNENNCSPLLTNVTIANNAGSTTLYTTGGTASLANTIVFGAISGNYSPQYCFIEGNTDNTNGNIDATGVPVTAIFNDAANGDYTLKDGAVVVNEGNNALNITETDLAGNLRIMGTNIDFGAFEQIVIIPDANGIVYVSTTGTGVGNSWNDATSDLHNAIHATGAQKVFVAIGNYPVGDNSFVMKNNVEIYGGFDPDNGIEDLDDERILPNHGTSEGSVLDGQNARPVIWNNNNSLNNTAVLDGFTVKNGYYGANFGGGIHNVSASPVLRNLVVKNNEASAGGGIYAASSSLELTNVIISNNHAYSASMNGGGGMFSFNSSPVLTNVLIINNTVNGLGGGFLGENGNPVFNNVTFAGNEKDAIAGTNITLHNSIVYKTGTIYGAIYGTYTAYNSLIEGNSNTANGNIDATGITVADIFTNPSAGDYTLKNGSPAVSVGQNTLFAGLDVTTVDLAGNPRVYNFANGGIIDLGAYESPYNGAVTPGLNAISYVREGFSGNGSSWELATGDLQKAINANGTQKVYVAIGNYDVPLPNSFVMKNGVEIYGGFDPDNSIEDLDDERILPTETINGSTLNGLNQKIVIHNNFPPPATAMGNTAVLDGFTVMNGNNSNGSGIRNVYASPILRNLVVRNNNASGSGAGIYNDFSSPLITDAVIMDNTSGILGGGIFNSNSSPVLTRVVIRGNTTTSTTQFGGGGVYNQSSSHTVMNNVTISNNTAGNTGGGIFCQSNSSIQVSNSTIENNTALYGGGLYNNGTASVFTNVIFKGNKATMNSGESGGGGIFNINAALALINVLITGNSTNRWGGGFRNLSGSPVFTNVTIADNTAVNHPGTTAMDIAGGNLQINNSIVYGAIAVTGSGSYNAQYSLIEGNTNTANGNLNATGITVTDIFTNPASGDYTLKNCAAGNNRGSNSLFAGLDADTKDLTGNPRVFDFANGGIIDMGAYEYQSDIFTSDITLSLNRETICHGSSVLAGVTFSQGTNPAFSWYLNDALVATTSDANYTFTNINEPGEIKVDVVFSECSTIFRDSSYVNLYPAPSVSASPTFQSICNQEAIAAITLTGDMTGTTFSWTRDNSANVTGIPAAGMGDISGELTNTTETVQTVTFTITPMANGCTGEAITASVRAYPAQTVDEVADQELCNGDPSAPVSLSGGITGTTFTWTNDNPSIGLASSGQGDIPSFTATNTSGVPQIANVTVMSMFEEIPLPVSFEDNGRRTTYSNVLINNTGNSAVIEPGSTVSLRFDALSEFLGYCPDCFFQEYIGIGGSNETIFCKDTLFDLDPASIAYSANVNFIAPALPGIYYLSFSSSLDFYCVEQDFQNDVDKAIGVIYVGFPSDPCFNPVSFEIKVNPTPTAIATPSSQIICSSNTITTIALGGEVSGTTYTWTRDNTTTVTGIPGSGTGNISGSLTNTTSAPALVTFTITPGVNDCPGAAISATVLVNPAPNATATPSSQTICSGSAITAIALSGTVSGTTYSWTRDNTATVTGIAASGSGDISGSLTNTTSAPVLVTFTVTPTANGCIGTPITATVLVNPIPNAITTPSSQTICSGSAIATIALSGAVPGTTYTWTRNNTFVTGIPASGSGSAISGTLTNNTQSPVTVTFTITPSANGCIGTPIATTVIVNPRPVVSASANPNPICTEQMLYLHASGGVLYNWSGPAGFSSSLQNPGRRISSVSQGGVYTVTVTSQYGCTRIASVNVTVNQAPTGSISAASQVVCVGGTIDLFASGGDSYFWSGPQGFTSTAQNPVIPVTSYQQSGEYSVVITSSQGCSRKLKISIKVLYPPVVKIGFDASTACVGGTLALFSSGGGTYSWSGPLGFTSSSPNPAIVNVTSAHSGVYTVTVTSPNGCTATASTTVSIETPPVLTAWADDADVCEGSTVFLHATGSDSYNWSGPWGYSSTYQHPVIHNIPSYMSGTYTVTGSSKKGCSAVGTVVINVGSNIEGTISATPNPVPLGATVRLAASGGTYYLWAGPGGFTSTEQYPAIHKFTSRNAGLYSVLITNTEGCQWTLFVKVELATARGEGIHTVAADPSQAVQGLIYPNPANSMITLQRDASRAVRYTIIDAAGRYIVRNKTTENAQVNISSLTPGIYQVLWNELSDQGQFYQGKLVRIE